MAKSETGVLVLFACSLVCVVLGTIHAFSVFLDPLERALGLPRATVSLTYSFALVALTVTVLLGPRLYSGIAPWGLFLGAGVIGAVGAIVAGVSPTITFVWLGYSLCFGVANGLGYGFALQFAARANPERAGLAMGIVTASYALGAALSPAIFAAILGAHGFGAAMTGLAGAVLIATTLAAIIVWRTGVKFETVSAAHDRPSAKPEQVARIWLAYGAGVTAGLMTIGHAAGIAGLSNVTPWHAPAVLAVCNLAGSLLSGHLADRVSIRALLASLPIVTALGLMLLVVTPDQTLLALGLVGFAYGGTISAYPAAIAKRHPGPSGPRVYGLVFTAWGTAGLLSPWLAGVLFDRTGTYDTVLWIATVLAAGSAMMALRIFKRDPIVL